MSLAHLVISYLQVVRIPPRKFGPSSNDSSQSMPLTTTPLSEPPGFSDTVSRSLVNQLFKLHLRCYRAWSRHSRLPDFQHFCGSQANLWGGSVANLTLPYELPSWPCLNDQQTKLSASCNPRPQETFRMVRASHSFFIFG